MAEKLYLECLDCGEVFDSMETALDHQGPTNPEVVFSIVPESEAF